jgi:hypothetical protein
MSQPIWKPVEIADDLLGQLRELLTSGAPDLALVQALERDGVRVSTADQVVREMRAVTGGDRQVSSDASVVYGVEVTMARRWLRTLDAKAQPTELVDALRQHGLSFDCARDFADDLLDDCRQQDARQGQRLRRLGLQGMVAGGLFTLFFGSVAWNGMLGPGATTMPPSEARWNAITAAMTLALTAYSALLWRRHRDQRSDRPER